jgi:hypothetical protein
MAKVRPVRRKQAYEERYDDQRSLRGMQFVAEGFLIAPWWRFRNPDIQNA